MLAAIRSGADDIENVLNDTGVSIEKRVKKAITLLPTFPRNDGAGSDGYRLFVLENTLLDLLEGWENGSI